MPRYALVITDPDKASAAQHEQEMAPHLAGLLAHGVPLDQARAHIASRVPKPAKVAGDLWTVADRECPLLRPNCEHCGDPAHADACRAGGHCEWCGTRHGIAPASRLVAVGVELVEVDESDAPKAGWARDAATGRFSRA